MWRIVKVSVDDAKKEIQGHVQDTLFNQLFAGLLLYINICTVVYIACANPAAPIKTYAPIDSSFHACFFVYANHSTCYKHPLNNLELAIHALLEHGVLDTRIIDNSDGRFKALILSSEFYPDTLVYVENTTSVDQISNLIKQYYFIEGDIGLSSWHNEMLCKNQNLSFYHSKIWNNWSLKFPQGFYRIKFKVNPDKCCVFFESKNSSISITKITPNPIVLEKDSCSVKSTEEICEETRRKRNPQKREKLDCFEGVVDDRLPEEFKTFLKGENLYLINIGFKSVYLAFKDQLFYRGKFPHVSKMKADFNKIMDHKENNLNIDSAFDQIFVLSLVYGIHVMFYQCPSGRQSNYLIDQIDPKPPKFESQQKVSIAFCNGLFYSLVSATRKPSDFDEITKTSAIEDFLAQMGSVGQVKSEICQISDLKRAEHIKSYMAFPHYSASSSWKIVNKFKYSDTELLVNYRKMIKSYNNDPERVPNQPKRIPFLFESSKWSSTATDSTDTTIFTQLPLLEDEEIETQDVFIATQHQDQTSDADSEDEEQEEVEPKCKITSFTDIVKLDQVTMCRLYFHGSRKSKNSFINPVIDPDAIQNRKLFPFSSILNPDAPTPGCNVAITHGRMNEHKAIASLLKYLDDSGVQVTRVLYPKLLVSDDGFFHGIVDALLEINGKWIPVEAKCPHTFFMSACKSAKDAIKEFPKNIYITFCDDREVCIKVDSSVFWQSQNYIHIMGAEYSYVIIWTARWFYVEKIYPHPLLPDVINKCKNLFNHLLSLVFDRSDYIMELESLMAQDSTYKIIKETSEQIVRQNPLGIFSADLRPQLYSSLKRREEFKDWPDTKMSYAFSKIVYWSRKQGKILNVDGFWRREAGFIGINLLYSPPGSEKNVLQNIAEMRYEGKTSHYNSLEFAGCRVSKFNQRLCRSATDFLSPLGTDGKYFSVLQDALRQDENLLRINNDLSSSQWGSKMINDAVNAVATRTTLKCRLKPGVTKSYECAYVLNKYISDLPLNPYPLIDSPVRRTLLSLILPYLKAEGPKNRDQIYSFVTSTQNNIDALAAADRQAGSPVGTWRTLTSASDKFPAKIKHVLEIDTSFTALRSIGGRGKYYINEDFQGTIPKGYTLW